MRLPASNLFQGLAGLEILAKGGNAALTDEQVAKLSLVKPADDSPEMKYLHGQRKALGGPG